MKNDIQRAEVVFGEDGFPRSVQFDDKYFCNEDGLAEALYVFCGGNDLQERWRKLSDKTSGVFTIVETGFGSGLNFLCAWKLWQECAPKNWQLHFISIDQFPLSTKDLSAVLRKWPTLDAYAQTFIQNYSQFDSQNFEFQESGIRLSLFVDHVVVALDQIQAKGFQADAWFLDGFAPRKNPDMWSEDVFARMAKLSAQQTTLATFTVAGSVRRGLKKYGFDVLKVEGFGQKRQMLKGHYKKD